MSEFESLIKRLMDASPGLTREEIDAQIRIKKEKIGAGYLTDQGALFLVASDMDVELSEPLQTKMALKDLYAGAKDVTVEARVMSVSSVREYPRKDGSLFKLRTMTIYDSEESCNVKLWDDRASMPILDGVKPGDPVKITGAYIKSDISGAHVVNLGEGSELEAADDLPDIPGIEYMAKDVGEISDTDREAIVTGKLDGMVSTMNFTNSRGKPGKALRMRIRGKNGISYRVVLWGQDDSAIPKRVPPQASVTLLGVRGKQTNQGTEVHGSESTVVQIQATDSAEPLKLRVLSVAPGDRGGNMVLCVDSARTLYFVMDAANHSQECGAGDIIECMPTKAYGKSVTADADAYIRRLDDDPSIPKLDALRTRLNDVQSGGDYCIEVVALKPPEIRDIQTRSGETIQLLEMFVGDDTEEIWLKGWRTQAKLAGGCKAGDRLSITGVNGRSGMEGKTELVLTAYSVITPVTDPKTP